MNKYKILLDTTMLVNMLIILCFYFVVICLHDYRERNVVLISKSGT